MLITHFWLLVFGTTSHFFLKAAAYHLLYSCVSNPLFISEDADFINSSITFIFHHQLRRTSPIQTPYSLSPSIKRKNPSVISVPKNYPRYVMHCVYIDCTPSDFLTLLLVHVAPAVASGIFAAAFSARAVASSPDAVFCVNSSSSYVVV